MPRRCSAPCKPAPLRGRLSTSFAREPRLPGVAFVEVEGITVPVEGVAAPRVSGRWKHGRLSSVLEHRAAAPLTLVVLAVVAYAPHVVSGGFLGDDWGYEADARIPLPLGTVISWLAPRTNHGELHAVYQLLVHRALAGNLTLHMIWLAVLAAGTALTFYCLLRELDVGRTAAAWMAAAAMLMPLAGATRLYVTAGAGSMAVLLALVGGLCAVRGLKSQGARRVPLHTLALGCYATSILVYEIALPVIALSLLFYVRVAPWRRALIPWLFDVSLVIVMIIHIESLTTLPTLPLSAQFRHAISIGGQAGEVGLGAGFLLPPRSQLHTWQYGLLAGSAVVLLTIAGLAHRSDRAQEVRRSYLTIATGVAFVAAAYSLFIPSVEDPLTPGLGLRVDGVAVLAYAVIFYGVGRLALAALPRRMPFGMTSPVLSVFVGCALIAAYIVQTEIETATYAMPRREQHALIANLTRSLDACFAGGPRKRAAGSGRGSGGGRPVLENNACGGIVSSWSAGPGGGVR